MVSVLAGSLAWIESYKLDNLRLRIKDAMVVKVINSIISSQTIPVETNKDAGTQ